MMERVAREGKASALIGELFGGDILKVHGTEDGAFGEMFRHIAMAFVGRRAASV